VLDAFVLQGPAEFVDSVATEQFMTVMFKLLKKVGGGVAWNDFISGGYTERNNQVCGLPTKIGLGN
jgi:hypothetical protein